MKKVKEIFDQFKDKLTPRERDCLRLRFGLDDNRQRTLEEVSELFGVTKKEIEQVINNAFEKAPEEISFMLKNLFIYNAYENLVNCIFAGQARLYSRNIDYDKLKEYSIKALNELEENESKVLSLRFGLAGTGEKNLVEAGNELGLSAERVRQIESKALRKLRHPERCKELKKYIDEVEQKTKTELKNMENKVFNFQFMSGALFDGE